jgi:uncharacterized protein YdeI (YjbR/CyaY-like superfamily)
MVDFLIIFDATLNQIMEPVFFKRPAEFRKWLKQHHSKETELLVGFYKTATGKPSMTWAESVEEALCFGWIDGVRKSMGEESYTIRFTPRKSTSIWSDVNIKKMAELQEQGRMTPAGLAAFSHRTEAKSRIYSHEQQEPEVLKPAYEKRFKANSRAWAYWQTTPPSYKKRLVHWVMGAKQEATQLSRLEKVIGECESERRMV